MKEKFKYYRWFWAAEIVVGLFLLGVSPITVLGIALLATGAVSLLHDCYQRALKELKEARES